MWLNRFERLFIVIFKVMNALVFLSSCSSFLHLPLLLPRSCIVELTFNQCMESIFHACSYVTYACSIEMFSKFAMLICFLKAMKGYSLI